MPAAAYVPERGDIVWLDLDPLAGLGQIGYRPVLVLSPRTYNGKAGLMLCCPLTTTVNGYPFEVPLSGQLVSTAALSDQIKSLDWRKRRAQKRGAATPTELAQVLGKIRALFGI
ncbi:endoribonuclease MazF [Inquilinus limosus]|uniref:endoribonuclease MazF n=1 Tax=Inquilinus limosus TaxID=171674 RepID=UPI003F180B00